MCISIYIYIFVCVVPILITSWSIAEVCVILSGCVPL